MHRRVLRTRCEQSNNQTPVRSDRKIHDRDEAFESQLPAGSLVLLIAEGVGQEAEAGHGARYPVKETAIARDYALEPGIRIIGSAGLG